MVFEIRVYVWKPCFSICFFPYFSTSPKVVSEGQTQSNRGWCCFFGYIKLIHTSKAGQRITQTTREIAIRFDPPITHPPIGFWNWRFRPCSPSFGGFAALLGLLFTLVIRQFLNGWSRVELPNLNHLMSPNHIAMWLRNRNVEQNAIFSFCAHETTDKSKLWVPWQKGTWRLAWGKPLHPSFAGMILLDAQFWDVFSAVNQKS